MAWKFVYTSIYFLKTVVYIRPTYILVQICTFISSNEIQAAETSIPMSSYKYMSLLWLLSTSYFHRYFSNNLYILMIFKTYLPIFYYSSIIGDLDNLMAQLNPMVSATRPVPHFCSKTGNTNGILNFMNFKLLSVSRKKKII